MLVYFGSLSSKVNIFYPHRYNLGLCGTKSPRKSMTNRKPLDTASQVILNDRLRNTKQWSCRQNQRESASGGLKKIPETGTVNHGLSALTFINKRYFILLEIIATVTGLF